MKYIRTKDGVYQYGVGGQPHPPYYCVPNWDSTKLITGEDLSGECPLEEHVIVKQADTIEELCDEFVVVYKNNRINQFKANEMGNETQTTNEFVKNNYLRFNNQLVYGAIWTNKGLIYVAKMNDEGELELL